MVEERDADASEVAEPTPTTGEAIAAWKSGGQVYLVVRVAGDGLHGEDVEYVCVRLAGARREVAEAELTAWVAARSPRTAADELARLLRRTDEPAHRALALYALRCNGERRDSARIRDGGRPLVAARGPRTGPLAIRARDAAGR